MPAASALQAKLAEAGIPSKEICCYGNQIVVTAWSRSAADKWATLLGKFSKVRAIVDTIDETQGTTHGTHKVVRVFAAIVP